MTYPTKLFALVALAFCLVLSSATAHAVTCHEVDGRGKTTFELHPIGWHFPTKAKHLTYTTEGLEVKMDVVSQLNDMYQIKPVDPSDTSIVMISLTEDIGSPSTAHASVTMGTKGHTFDFACEDIDL